MSLTHEWNEALRAAGARFEDDILRNFGDLDQELRAAREDGVVCDLGHLATISASGEEARSFLQGQLTCDLNELTPSHGLMAAWCTPKGRVQTLFRLIQWQDAILLELPRQQLEFNLSRLRMYLLRARAQLENRSADFIRLGVSGESCVQLIADLFAGVPESADEMIAHTGAAAVRLRGALPRFELVFEQLESARTFWQQASERLRPAGSEAWQLLNVLAGTPEAVDPDEYLPQMLNLDALGGLSFTKGCYVGQEIVARTQHLGRLKRRMFRLHLETDEAPAAGAPVFADGGVVEADGRLLQSCSDPRGGCAALGVIRLESAQRPLRLNDGTTVRIDALPYAQQASAAKS